MTNIPPDAKTTMAIRKATGLAVLQAREFIQSSPPELIQRILDGHTARSATRIQDASDTQPDFRPLHDPLENDPTVGPVIRSVLEQAARDMEAKHGRVLGLCHSIWHTARERLLQEHSIVWYSPAQLNPGCCFD